MSAIVTANHASVSAAPRRAWIATATFDTYIFSYDGKQLQPLAEATCFNCHAGKILKETGKKLYPKANPGVNQYYVGVYDERRGIKGFIHTNDHVFAPYSSDRPTYDIDYDSSDGETEGSLAEGYGPGILTSGNVVTSDGFIGVQSSIATAATYAGAYLWENTPIVEAGVNFPQECINSTLSTLTYATLYPDGTIESYNNNDETVVRLTAAGNIYNTGNTSTMGDVYVANDMLVANNVSTVGNLSYTGGLRVPEPALAGAVNLGLTPDPGSGYKYVTVTASGCRASSRVFLTYKSLVNAGILSAESIDNGSFVIVSSNRLDDSTVQYFIVN